MSITALDFAKPFFDVDYLEGESAYAAMGRCLVFNLDVRGKTPLFIRGIPVQPLKGTVVCSAALTNVARALVIRDFDRFSLEDPEVVSRLTQRWTSLYASSGKPEHLGLPYYKTQPVQLGRDITVKLVFVSAPMTPSGPHREHPRPIDEVHAQILGIGKVERLGENDPASVYQEDCLAPGGVHDLFCDENGVYPWHQYCSVTPCIYMPVEIDR